jgi:PIN like domain
MGALVRGLPAGHRASARRVRVRPAAEVRFYVDADILGLAHVLAGLRADVTYPGDQGATIKRKTRAACPVQSPAAKDPEWIPVVAARGWLILTRDGKIQAHPGELAAVGENVARMVALDTEQARGTFEQLEIVMCRWRQIMDLIDQPGPFIYVASRTKLRRVPLD